MSFYNNRPTYATPSWKTRRLVPETEPNFNNITQNDNLSQPIAPPPLYYRGSNSNVRTNSTELETAQQTLARSYYYPTSDTITTTKSLATTVLDWEYNVAFVSAWNRPKIWWYCLIGETSQGIRSRGERLSTNWPSEFGGGISYRKDVMGVEIGTESSRRDSGFASEAEEVTDQDSVRHSTSSRRLSTAISLAPTIQSINSTTLPIHPNAPEFLTKITLLNNAINSSLIRTRVILSLLEITAWIIAILLIVSIVIEKGRQGTFMEAVEVGLVLLIIGSGIGIGIVRMHRFALSRTLRSLSRDWNPLPVATTNSNGFGSNQTHHYLERPDNPPSSQPQSSETEERERRRKEVEEAAKPKLRWNMRSIEGFYHLSYRPIIKVELFTPSSFIPIRSPSISAGGRDGLERVTSTTSSTGLNGRRTSTRVPVPVIDQSEERVDERSRVEELVGEAVVPPYSPN